MGSTEVAEQSPIPMTERRGSEASPSPLPWDGADGHERLMPSLPPVDGGKHAWFFLAACFVVEALTWGKNTHPGFATTRPGSRPLSTLT